MYFVMGGILDVLGADERPLCALSRGAFFGMCDIKMVDKLLYLLCIRGAI